MLFDESLRLPLVAKHLTFSRGDADDALNVGLN